MDRSGGLQSSRMLLAAMGTSYAFACVFLLALLFSRSQFIESQIFRFVPPIYSTDVERAAAQKSVRSFLQNELPLPVELFTTREISHLHDVRELLAALTRSTAGACVIFFIAFALARRQGLQWRRTLRTVSRFAVAFIALVILILSVWFETLFEAMHRVFFTNDFWLLDSSQHLLIQAYPPDFFRVLAFWYLASLLCWFGAMSVLPRSDT